jgi:hypothetical protein
MQQSYDAPQRLLFDETAASCAPSAPLLLSMLLGRRTDSTRDKTLCLLFRNRIIQFRADKHLYGFVQFIEE